jgi:peptidyl-prolyl cis-trans isomerase D
VLPGTGDFSARLPPSTLQISPIAMLQTIRDRASGWLAYLIIGMLIIPFALWGINSYFDYSGPLVVAEVGDASISQQDFQRVLQQQRQQLPQVDSAMLKNLVLQQLVNDRVLGQAVRAQGLRVSDPQLFQAIQDVPAFQQDGKFDAARYEQVLRAQGLSQGGFEEDLRRSLAQQQLREGLTGSAIVTSAEVAQLAVLFNQQREFEYLLLPLKRFQDQATVDDAAVTTYFQEHQDRFQHPEQVQVQYLELKVEQLAEGVAVSEDELKAFYQEQSSRYQQPEERSASQILFKAAPGAKPEDLDPLRERAQAVAREIAAGKRFDQALQENQAAGGVEGGSLGVIGKGLAPDPAFETALYGLKDVGAVSEPVATSYGFHLIRLDGITPERIRPFEDVRDELTRDLRLRQAETRFYDVAEQLSRMIYEHPDSLEPAAQSLDLTVQDSGWFGRKGGEGIAANPKVVEAAFSEEVLKRGVNSEPVEAGDNHLVVVRLKEHHSATPRTLEESREDIVQELRQQQAREAIGKVVTALRERVSKGESLAALVSESGGELKQPGLVKRREVGKADGAVLREAFRLAVPVTGQVTVGSVQLANGDQAVIVLRQIVPGKPEDMAEAERKALVQQLVNQAGTAELQGFLDSLRQETKIVIHDDRL